MTRQPIEKRIDELREEIRRHDVHYYVEDKPVITDRQYDALLAELKKLESQHPHLVTPDSPTQRVGGQPIAGFASVRHAVPMLSIDNTYDEAQVREFDARVAKLLGDEKYRYVIDPKVDGVAVSLTYVDGLLTTAATRGDGETGDDVTHNVRVLRSVPLRLLGKDVPARLEVRGEIYWPMDDFLRFNEQRAKAGEEEFKNPRNATAGTLKQLDPKNLAGRNLRFVAHGYGAVEPLPAKTWSDFTKALARWGLPTSPDQSLAADVDAVLAHIHTWDKKRHTLPYLVDGLVIKVDSLAQRDELGATSRFPRWCIAYKFEPEQAESVILRVDYQVGKQGTITPRAALSPVELSGTTVRHATLHNFDQVDRLDVRIGDTVLVEKAGEIIPQVIKVIVDKRPRDAKPIQRPTKCPQCRGDVEQDEGGVYIRCVNPACPAQIKERLIYFAGRDQMAIEGAGDVLIDALVEKGYVKDFADLYNLKNYKDELAELRLQDKELGWQRIDDLADAIARARTTECAAMLSKLKSIKLAPVAIKEVSFRFPTAAEMGAALSVDFDEIRGITNSERQRLKDFFITPTGSDLHRNVEVLAKALGVKGMGPVLLEKLCTESFLRRVGDLFQLPDRRRELTALKFRNTLGPKNTENLLEGVERSKRLPLSRLLAALTIRHVGTATAQLLADYFQSLDAIRAADEKELVQIDGIGPGLAHDIHQFFHSDWGRRIIDRLVEAGVNGVQPKRTIQVGSRLEGKTVVVTGTLERYSRKQIKDLILALGGKPTDSVSKSTDYLIVGSDPGSKYEKANELGITILTEADLELLIGR